MRADLWIALCILIGAVVYVVHRALKGGTKEERHRTRAIADATARRHEVLLPDEQKLADIWHAEVEDERERTGEQPIMWTAPKRRYVRRHIGRRLAARERHIRAYAAARETFLADPLTAPLALIDGASPVLSSVPLFEPEPWDLESFTRGWTAARIAQMVAEASAEASR